MMRHSSASKSGSAIFGSFECRLPDGFADAIFTIVEPFSVSLIERIRLKDYYATPTIVGAGAIMGFYNLVNLALMWFGFFVVEVVYFHFVCVAQVSVPECWFSFSPSHAIPPASMN
jgi:hypothetical protein